MTERSSPPVLEVRGLESGYGKKQVLFGVSLDVVEHKITALIGPNGSGKSTLLKAVVGILPTWRGETRFAGIPVTGSTPAGNVARGITFCPQGSRVFGSMTVLENLEMGGFLVPRRQLKARLHEALQIFPALGGRSNVIASTLSGGEQQMLSLARALVTNPRLLLLDEPSLGLSPQLMKFIFQMITEMSTNRGVTILVVEQKVREVLGFAARVYSLRLGKVAYAGTAESLRADTQKLKGLFL